MTDRSLPRSRAESGAGADLLPPDRVFLDGYVREIEIGAYAEERGVSQRVRFDIRLEVATGNAPRDDRVGRVINYDTLIEAIDTAAAGPRVNLLETFAERLAQLCLADPRALRVHLRLAKLDRLEGGATLGCEITRARTPEANETVWSLADEVEDRG